MLTRAIQNSVGFPKRFFCIHYAHEQVKYTFFSRSSFTHTTYDVKRESVCLTERFIAFFRFLIITITKYASKCALIIIEVNNNLRVAWNDWEKKIAWLLLHNVTESIWDDNISEWSVVISLNQNLPFYVFEFLCHYHHCFSSSLYFLYWRYEFIFIIWWRKFPIAFQTTNAKYKQTQCLTQPHYDFEWFPLKKNIKCTAYRKTTISNNGRHYIIESRNKSETITRATFGRTFRVWAQF